MAVGILLCSQLFLLALARGDGDVAGAIQGLQKDLSRLENRVKALEAENGELKAALKSPIVQRRQLNAWDGVGFTGVISQHSTFNASQVIVFDRMTSNIGGAYNPQTGYFVAPVPGTYMFYTTVMSESGGYIETSMMKDGQELLVLYSGANSGFDSSGNLVIVNLKQGDHVWIQVHGRWSSNFKIHCCFSSFSGYLLREMEDAGVTVG